MSKLCICIFLLSIGDVLMVCTPKSKLSEAPSSQEDLLARGRSIYQTSCTSCHNANPNLDGSVGPAVANSPRELIERRVIYGDYPVGFTPKRQSHLMVALPHLKAEIEALFVYLNSKQ